MKRTLKALVVPWAKLRGLVYEDKDFAETYSGFSSHLIIDPNTGHMRFDPMPPRALLDDYYNGTFTRSEDQPTPEREFTQQILEIMRGLKSYLQDTGGLEEGFSFHDVGCGFGASVWSMLQLGVRATGNEVNRSWIDAANPHCGGKLSAEPLDHVLSALSYRVDAFFCAHVLEHVTDPLSLLKLMAKHMSDEGVAYLCMPNIHSVRTIRRGIRDSGAYAFPMHLNYFTPKSLVAMVRQAGLEPVQIETRSMFEDGATPQDCEELRGWELFMLAVKPGNTLANRQGDIDQKCAEAYRYFNCSLPATHLAALPRGRLVRR